MAQLPAVDLSLYEEDEPTLSSLCMPASNVQVPDQIDLSNEAQSLPIPEETVKMMLTKLHQCIYQHITSCNMKNTAAAFLRESNFFPLFKASTVNDIPTDILSQCWTLFWNKHRDQVAQVPRPITSTEGYTPSTQDLSAFAAWTESLIRRASQDGNLNANLEYGVQTHTIPILLTPKPEPTDEKSVVGSCADIKEEEDQTDDQSDGRKTLFACKYSGCNGIFTTLANMKRHEKLHSGEKPYSCSFENCGKSFARKYDMKVHLRTHTKEKPYQCSLNGCSTRFSRISSLREHERNIHGVNLSTYNRETKETKDSLYNNINGSDAISPLTTLDQASVKQMPRFQCAFPDCKQEFTDPVEMELHQQTVHEPQFFHQLQLNQSDNMWDDYLFDDFQPAANS